MEGELIGQRWYWQGGGDYLHEALSREEVVALKALIQKIAPLGVSSHAVFSFASCLPLFSEAAECFEQTFGMRSMCAREHSRGLAFEEGFFVFMASFFQRLVFCTDA